ncbi:MAG TPA: reverse transcriptase-like protein, partial [Nannocystaceae bacterium]|nr:reverse transcriptase-like protein [Nannocystaceae bacterium]
MSWIGHFDGACEPYNPGGWGGWGFAIWDPSATEIASGYGVLEKGRGMTNNVAEYTAALECVRRWIALAIAGPIVVRGDSKLVIEQMSGRWKVKAGAYVAVYRELCVLRCDSGTRSGGTRARVPAALGHAFRRIWAPIPGHSGTDSGRTRA